MSSKPVPITTVPRVRRRQEAQPHATPNVSAPERVAAGIAGGALLLAALRRGGVPGLVLGAIGGALAYRAASGYCPVYEVLNMNTATPQHNGIIVERSVTINRPREELYLFWRNFENLPRVMDHLQEVHQIDDTHSHWVAKAPAGREVSWDAEIVAEKPDALISWRSVEGSGIDNRGSVRFTPAPGNRGTEVKVSLEYAPPGGAMGAVIAKMFGEEPEIQIENDLRRFKQLMETGELTTTVGQPSARSHETSNTVEGART